MMVLAFILMNGNDACEVSPYLIINLKLELNQISELSELFS